MKKFLNLIFGLTPEQTRKERILIFSIQLAGIAFMWIGSFVLSDKSMTVIVISFLGFIVTLYTLAIALRKERKKRENDPEKVKIL